MSGKGSGWYAAGAIPGMIATSNSKSKNGTSINIPEFQRPDVPTFSLPGYGSTTFDDNTYGLKLDPNQMDWQTQVNALRSSVLSELGITSPERKASLDQWQKTFTDEALRTSMPQLEQTLFSRGLGGSEFYKGAVNDLLSKITTQGVLSREDLSNRDEQLKLQQLGAIAGLSQQDLQNMMSFLGMSVNQGNFETSLAQSRYLSTLPYTMSITERNNGLGGALSGALQGASAGSMFGPWGAAIGAGVGGATGYAGSRGSTTTPYALYNSGSGGGGASPMGGSQWLQYLDYLKPIMN